MLCFFFDHLHLLFIAKGDVVLKKGGKGWERFEFNPNAPLNESDTPLIFDNDEYSGGNIIFQSF
jgi:hypothetical protein